MTEHPRALMNASSKTLCGRRLVFRLLPWVLPAVLVFLWWLVAKAAIFPPILLPAPQTVFSRAVELIATGELFRHAATSLARVGAGFLLSATLALFAAFFFYRHPIGERAASILLESLRIVPPLSLVPLLILWLGIDEAPKLAIVVLASFFPIYLSSLDALKTTGGRFASLSRVLGLSTREHLVHILLPGAAPGIFTGLRLGFGYAWRALVGAELIAAASGLGYLIEDASMLARTDVVMVGILTIAVLGVLCDALFKHFLEGLLKRKARRAPVVASGSKSDSNEADAANVSRESLSARIEESTCTECADPMRLPAVLIKDLQAGYPDETGTISRLPLRALTLSLERGAVTALLGRSGCGKTTLLKVIAGLLPKTGGALRFDYGETKSLGSTERRPVLGVVFQTPMLLPWKTVQENVELALLSASETKRRAEAQRALALAGLADRADDWPENLSGGQQQRVGFARALARSPELLLMDEPFGALDALTRSELQLECVRILSRTKMTVLMITHDVREAVAMADRIALMSEGTVKHVFDATSPKPRRLSDPEAAALEERILDELMRLKA